MPLPTTTMSISVPGTVQEMVADIAADYEGAQAFFVGNAADPSEKRGAQGVVHN